MKRALTGHSSKRIKKRLPYYLILNLTTLLLLNSGYSNNILSLQKLSNKELFDTANHYFFRNNVDTALICYGLVVKTPEKSNPEQQIRTITALNRMGIIYTNMSDYRNAYKNLIDALLLCEEYNITSELSKIYNNLGNIYYHFKKYDIAKSYYYKAINLCEDTARVDGYYNNFGITISEIGEIDSAFYFLYEALKMCKNRNSDRLCVIPNSLASLYLKIKQYDSAYYYYKISLNESRKNNQIKYEVQNLSELSELFFEINKIDSALFYMDLSNRLAEKNNFLKVIAENYLVRAKIEEFKGNKGYALEYYKKYADLRDSVFNTSIFGDINQLQRLYEVSQTDRQIEELVIKQRVREQVIFVILCVLVLVCVGLLYIYLQKRNLNKAYKVLFEKNLEVINLKENLSAKSQDKEKSDYKKKDYVFDIQDELFDKILLAMEDSSLVCDAGFSIDKLAAMVQSNHTYVAQVIKNVTNKNFRSFLNSYRISEAQRIFSEPDISKYTIESVALRVGFKSRSSFYNAFKEITGVNPNFYLKSMQKQH